MKKFISKCIALLLLIASSIAVLNYLYIKTTYWKKTVTELTEKFKDVPGGIQLANVGSSHGELGFDYTGIPYRAFNFALSSQRHIYNYALLEQYINHFDKKAVLLIPISYFEITRIQINFTDVHARYYRFLEKQFIESYSLSEKILFNFVPILTAGNTINFIIKDMPLTNEPMTEAEFIDYCNEKYKGWTATDNPNEIEAGEEGFSYNQRWVIKIIEFCYAHDIKPVLITTPITSILNNIYAVQSPDFFDTFYRFTHEILEAYPSLTYFDYSHDQRFENDFSLFQDGDHLNSLGAEKFTAIVISDLQSGGLLSF
ncbi:hypothetical protein AGMMS50268_37920 [Spirochaetia bacterium]|nr:hypothetical protein AGMMS50268_37920 [Spirochaetia bacterium]